ncbi:MAG: pantetheine-phosphate adenylyltransferase [Caulobacterales bacterium]
MSGKRIGIYPGTFDPVTLGHIDIICRGARLVDQLIVAVGVNEGKSPMFSPDERIALIEAECQRMRAAEPDLGEITIRPFDTLLVQFARSVGATVIVRGLRSVADFDYELQMTNMNTRMAPDLETIFLPAAPEHQGVSSSLVKVVARGGGDFSFFVSAEVERRLKAKVGGA